MRCVLQYHGAEGEGYNISFLGFKSHVIVRSKQEQVGTTVVLPSWLVEIIDVNVCWGSRAIVYYNNTIAKEESCGDVCGVVVIFQLTAT